MTITKTHQHTGKKAEVEITPELIATIALFNTYLTAEEVELALRGGHRVYTNFSYYQMEVK